MKPLMYSALGVLVIVGTLALSTVSGCATDGITTWDGRYAFVAAPAAPGSGQSLVAQLWRIDRRSGKVELITGVAGQPGQILIARER
jgi:hypothetical protein